MGMQGMGGMQGQGMGMQGQGMGRPFMNPNMGMGGMTGMPFQQQKFGQH